MTHTQDSGEVVAKLRRDLWSNVDADVACEECGAMLLPGDIYGGGTDTGYGCWESLIGKQKARGAPCYRYRCEHSPRATLRTDEGDET